MHENERIDDLLDEWEVWLVENPDAGFEAFVQSRRIDLVDELLTDLRQKAMALAAINKRIEAFQDTSRHPDGTTGGSSQKLALARLRDGFEPIPGYRLIDRLGRGGFGEVWKAIGPGGFPVALKFVLLGGKAGDIEERSLEVMRDVRHPHLLSVFGTWQSGDLLIIATELADQTLWDRYQETVTAGSKGLPLAELLEYMTEAAKGIDFLNASITSGRPKIQHRDIKPQNLLVSGGSIKVGDFGLARVVQFDATGHTGSMTLAYAAPEFLDGRTSNHSDQYSLAVTYCLLRSGQLPFQGTAAQIIDGHRKNKPDLSLLSEPEQPIVHRALSKRPTDRWPSCSAFVTALKSQLEPTTKQSLSTFRGLLHVFDNITPRLKILAGVFAAATLVLAVLLLRLTSGNDAPREEASLSPKQESGVSLGNLEQLLADFPTSFVAYHTENVAAARFSEKNTKHSLIARIDTEHYQRFVRKLDSRLAPSAISSGQASLGLASETARRADYGVLQYGKMAPRALADAIHKAAGYAPGQHTKPEGCVILLGERFLETPWGNQDRESLVDYEGGDRVLAVKWHWVSESAARPLLMAFRSVREIEISLSIGETSLPAVRPGTYSWNRYDCMISPGGPAGSIFGRGTGGGALNVWAARGDVNQKFVAKFGIEPRVDRLPMLDAERVLLVMPAFFADGTYADQIKLSDLPPELVNNDNVDELKIQVHRP